MKAIAFRSKKAKGSRLEHKVASLIRESGLDDNAKRMIGSGAFAGWKTDLFTTLPFSFEIKNQETTKPWEWFRQAEEAATIAKPPIVVFSGNNRPIMTLLKFEVFLDLLLEIKQLNELLNEAKINK